MRLAHPCWYGYPGVGLDLVRLEGRQNSREVGRADAPDHEYRVREWPEPGTGIDLRDLRVHGLDIGAPDQADERFSKYLESRMLKQVAAYRTFVVISVKEPLDRHERWTVRFLSL